MAIMSRPPVFESYSTADVPRGCRCTVIIPNGPVVTAVAAARVGDGYMEIHGLERAAHAKAIAKAVVELEQSRTNYGRIIGSASGETMPQKLQYEWRAVDGAAKQELRHE